MRDFNECVDTELIKDGLESRGSVFKGSVCVHPLVLSKESRIVRHRDFCLFETQEKLEMLAADLSGFVIEDATIEYGRATDQTKMQYGVTK